jgi:hypothetical protein
MITNTISPIVRADELIEGIVIKHLGETWRVYSTPVYTRHGIEFDILPLSSNSPVRTVQFDPQWRFTLIPNRSA